MSPSLIGCDILEIGVILDSLKRASGTTPEERDALNMVVDD